MIKPIHRDIVVEPMAEDNTTSSGIIVSSEIQHKETMGTVVSIGAEVTAVKPGDIVMYSRFSGTPIEHEGEELLVMHEADLLCIIEE